ncbi:esterase [Tenacibaculum phage pT24]|uniref:Esterase n=1 Tax=Tenacibaculum phage pT24 TaxID=1880590 RepID=A0A1B4XWJ9_9CAUD|nr:esterase/lipase [Tenacibaculum phage pT24]BAV39179.1 esterase [Tenacibaculum phage pT24]
MKNILFLNGFNGGKGSKYGTLRNTFNTVYHFNYSNDVDSDLDRLQKFIDKFDIEVVVGCSLGGWFCLQIADKNKDVDFHLINPSYNPYTNMVKRIGNTYENFVTGVKLEVTKEYADGFKNKIVKPSNTNTYVYIGGNDDVLNYDELDNAFLATGMPYFRYETNQDHRHSDISEVINNIHASNELL